MIPQPPRSTRTDTLFPYTTLFRSALKNVDTIGGDGHSGPRVVMAATRIPRSRETTKRMTTPSDHPSRAHPRVIDVQTHYVPPAAARLLHDVRVAGIADALEPNSAICTLDARLRAMDEAEVDVSVLSMAPIGIIADRRLRLDIRSEEHTSELQTLMRNSYAGFCL